jgi:hypothetical protein
MCNPRQQVVLVTNDLNLRLCSSSNGVVPMHIKRLAAFLEVISLCLSTVPTAYCLLGQSMDIDSRLNPRPTRSSSLPVPYYPLAANLYKA